MYRITKSTDSREYWKCIENCGATLITIKDSRIVSKKRGEHFHLPDISKHSVKKATPVIANKMRTSTRPYSTIYREVVGRYVDAEGIEFA